MRIFSILFLSLCNFAQYASADILLETTLGQVKGFLYETTTPNVNAEVFLNIPYAKPPVGDLRFEKPQPASPWSSAIDGTKFGACCVPHARAGVLPTPYFPAPNEDCLTINVIRPQKEAPIGGYPILVWVHGGGYEIGSASLYGYKGFGNIYIPQDVIIVTVQYRIGVYGFLSTGTKDLPGNLGMFDLALAVKFIYDNAEWWGADKSRITYWGLSAGGALVGQLAMSPYARDYVSGTIEMSGSATANWARNPLLKQHSIELGKALGCDDVASMKECLKTKTVDEIFAAVDETESATDHIMCVKYGPQVDGDFFPKEPEELIKESRKVPALIGVGSKEASFFTHMARSPTIHQFSVQPDELESFSEDTLKEMIEKRVARNEFYSDSKMREEAKRRLFEFYGEARKPSDADYSYYLDEYTRMLSDGMFNVAAAEIAALKRDAGYNVYLYQFDHYNDAIWPNTTERLRGSPHVNEYAYMFQMFLLGKYDITTIEEKTVNDLLMQSIISFVKTGSPHPPNNLKWPKLTGNSMEYMSISSTPKMKPNFQKDSTEFWTGMRSLGYDLIRGIRTDASAEVTVNDDCCCCRALFFIAIGMIVAMAYN